MIRFGVDPSTKQTLSDDLAILPSATIDETGSLEKIIRI